MSTLGWMPSIIRTPLANAKHAYVRSKKRGALRTAAENQSMKIVVGAASTSYEGWHATDMDILNLLKSEDWIQYFKPDSVEAILSEHVWEHLSAAEGRLAAQNCYRFLKPGGRLRVAVPDGNHPDQTYIDAVKPGGYGPGSDDHKVLYTYQSLAAIFESAGFQIEPLEHFDDNGQFVENDWDQAHGMIVRSKRFDGRNKGGKLAYTSIILDAIKPISTESIPLHLRA